MKKNNLPGRGNCVFLHRRFNRSRSGIYVVLLRWRRTTGHIKETCNSVYLRRIRISQILDCTVIMQCSSSIAWYIIVYIIGVGFGIVYLVQSGNARAFIRGISKLADSRASFLCCFEYHNSGIFGINAGYITMKNNYDYKNKI